MSSLSLLLFSIFPLSSPFFLILSLSSSLPLSPLSLRLAFPQYFAHSIILPISLFLFLPMHSLSICLSHSFITSLAFLHLSSLSHSHSIFISLFHLACNPSICCFFDTPLSLFLNLILSLFNSILLSLSASY